MAQHTARKPETLTVVKLMRKSVLSEHIHNFMLIQKNPLLAHYGLGDDRKLN